MKILQIASGDIWAGAENQVYQLASSLNHKDIDVVLLTFNEGKLSQKLRILGIKVYVVDESNMGGWDILVAVRRIINQERPDIVHTHGFKENILGAFSVIGFPYIKSVRTVHGRPETKVSEFNIKAHIFNLLDRLAAMFQDRYVSVSKELFNYVKRKYGSGTLIIENGINIEQTLFNSNKWDIPGNYTFKYNVGFIGRLKEIKNPKLFIDIQKRLRENGYSTYQFLIYGNGPMKVELDKYINSRKLDDCVKMMGHEENIEAAIRKLDILLITSKNEGLPMVLLEAMALNIPVMSTNVGGISDVLDAGECGTLIDCDSIEGFVSHLIDYTLNSDEYMAKANKAYLKVVNHYSSDINSQKHIELYKEVIDG